MSYTGSSAEDPRLLQALSRLAQGLGRFVVAKRGTGRPTTGQARADSVLLLNLVTDHWSEYRDLFGSERQAIVALQETLAGSAPVLASQVPKLLAQIERVLNQSAPREAEQVSQLLGHASSTRWESSPPPPPSAIPYETPRNAAPAHAGAAKWGLLLLLVVLGLGGGALYLHQDGKRQVLDMECGTRIKALAEAITQYAMEKGSYPPADGWTTAIEPYRKKVVAELNLKAGADLPDGPFGCPLSGPYLYNSSLAGKAMEDFVDELKEVAVLRDAEPRHRQGAGVAFADGHRGWVQNFGSLRWDLGQAERGSSDSSAPTVSNNLALVGYITGSGETGRRVYLKGGWDPQNGWQLPPGSSDHSLPILPTSMTATEWHFLSLDPTASAVLPLRTHPDLTLDDDGPFLTATETPPAIGLVLSRQAPVSPVLIRPAPEDLLSASQRAAYGAFTRSYVPKAIGGLIEIDLADIDGNGQDEVVVVQQSHHSSGERMDKGETYAAAFLEYEVNGERKKQQLLSLRDQRAVAQNFPPQIGWWIVDANGDGENEIVTLFFVGAQNTKGQDTYAVDLVLFGFNGREVTPVLDGPSPWERTLSDQ